MANGGAEVDGIPTGTYIVEAVPPMGYEVVKCQDKNVDCGDAYTPSPLLLPECVGDPYVVPPVLSLFPDQAVDAALAGTTQRGPDRREVVLNTLKNANCDFFFFTAVPKAAPYPAHPIQDAIDAASPGDLILVGPGAYDENVILWKPVKLQGAGAGSTILRANPNPGDRLTAWHAKVQQLLGTPGTDPFTANDAPGIMVLGDAGVPFLELHQVRIDGFYVTGAKVGGAIGVASGAHYLQIGNNRLKGNNARYAVWRASDLSGGAFARLTNGLPATPPANTYPDPAPDADRAFYRIQQEP